MELALILLVALILDRVFGEIKRFHPLVGFGNVASRIESKLNQLPYSGNQKKVLGMIAWLLVVSPIVLSVYYLSQYFSWWLDALLVYLAIGGQSLKEHAIQVYKPLVINDIKSARHYCGYLVSRETDELDETEISRAVVESVLENGHDAVIASLFWYCVGGLPLLVAHRLANTLDAMWGYKNDRFVNFGWFSAKVDDLLGWPSAKVTALLYAVQSTNWQLCLKNAYCQSKLYKSLNGGWAMASGATALFIELGGEATYFGQKSQPVRLGQGNKVSAADIPASVSLVTIASYYFVASVAVIELVM